MDDLLLQGASPTQLVLAPSRDERVILEYDNVRTLVDGVGADDVSISTVSDWWYRGKPARAHAVSVENGELSVYFHPGYRKHDAQNLHATIDLGSARVELGTSFTARLFCLDAATPDEAQLSSPNGLGSQWLRPGVSAYVHTPFDGETVELDALKPLWDTGMYIFHGILNNPHVQEAYFEAVGRNAPLVPDRFASRIGRFVSDRLSARIGRLLAERPMRKDLERSASIRHPDLKLA